MTNILACYRLVCSKADYNSQYLGCLFNAWEIRNRMLLIRILKDGSYEVYGINRCPIRSVYWH